MVHSLLTKDGIQTLAALRGSFRETNVVVNLYLPEDSESGLAVISDGFQCLHVLNETNIWSQDVGIWINNCSVIRIRKAMFCPYGDGTLLLPQQSIQFIPSHPMGPYTFPENFYNNENIQNGEIIIPLRALSYFEDTNRYPAIRGLVTFKSRLHDPYFGYRGTEPFFVIHIEDESLEVRFSAMDEIAIELYDRFEEGRIYSIEDFSRGPNQPPLYNLSTSSTYAFTNATYIEECPQDNKSPPQLSFNFVPISGITKIRRHAHIDVLGIVNSVGVLTWNRERQMIPQRKITVIDQSGLALPVTLWSYRAVEFDIKPLTIVALRHVRVYHEDYGVSVLSTSTIHIEPDGVEEVYALRRWFDQVGHPLDFHVDSKTSMICDIDTSMVVD